ncbi:hypothetical protein AGDE_10974 [Angomonas deanei]|uniref:Uncharacterized protein n=1 Tax=Angomonas deanei TaxID=59799 RepID=A0A7G2CPT7_9TRYP|nr:hypothetical protein AGDE_10974 [Angomonas deanei]CAD2221505.1 hypothetical protein, conserved [Angomonas deanei]|eukprot:EPY27022.1 hypothetical protein AGDE_10974 [Angomonas deanei]
MGYTTFKLSERQRAGYSWNDLEDFIMYKEHKYNSINILSRFVTFLLLCLSITIFCHAFSVSSTEWRAVRYVDYYQSIGLFVKCTETSYKQCNIRTSTNFERQLADAVTGQILCYADNSANSRTVKFVQKYIGAMWSLEILNLFFDAVVFVLLVVMSYRPTRSHILALILFLLFLNTVCGIVVCVLFPIYTRCEGKTCQARQGLPTASQKGVTCSVSFLWGYKLYIGVTVLHFLCFIISFCMHNAILNIRTNTRRRLRKERKRRRKLKRLSGANYVLREAASPEDLALQNSLPSTVTVLPSSPEYEAARERYLTARELGVRIPGADDWLYDERSDMYYSFGQNCFWDPLTSEYYNCTLGSWQEEIQHIVEVRDVLEYTTQIPPGGGDDEEEELQSLQEEPTSEEKTK